MKVGLGLLLGWLPWAVSPLAAQDLPWPGCYAMEREAWTWTKEDEDSTQFVPPRVFRLLPPREAGAPSGEVLPAMMSYQTAPGEWRAEGVDSLFVVWSNGFTAVWIEAVANGDSATGTANAFSDAWGRFATVPATLRRVSCDSLRLNRRSGGSVRWRGSSFPT